MGRIAIFLVLCAAAPALADPVVLAVDGPDIYVGLGAKDGVGAGSELELLHVVVAHDPRTGATLRDRFALGTITVDRSGDAISVAHADPALARRVLAGDGVRLVSPRRRFIDPWAAQVAASRAAAEPAPAPGAPAIDHAELARRAWQDTLGQPPERRIARWTALLAADPHTPYAHAIATELASLRAQIAERDAALARARRAATDRSPQIAELVHALAEPSEVMGAGGNAPGGVAEQGEAGGDPLIAAPIPHALPGRRLELAFLVRAPAAIAAAWLYVRPAGDPGFHRIALVRDGDAYLRGAIDGSLVRAPGVDWYVEAAPAGAPGRAEPVIAGPGAPRTIAVDREVAEPPPAAGRSHVDLHFDYVDFDGRLARGFDQYSQIEGDFGYRFLDPVYAVRLGFGTLSGMGGPKDVIDADPDGCVDATGTYRCKRVTFSYVYTELELRLRPNLAVMLRPQAGLLTTDEMPGSDAGRCEGRDVTGCAFQTGLGARLRVRLGAEQGTNLVLGAAFTRGVGTLFEAAYHWLPAATVPVQLSVQVTDQPVVESFGVRLIGDVGWRRLSWFYPSLRVSYQARDINHAGVSGGAALNFDW